MSMKFFSRHRQKSHSSKSAMCAASPRADAARWLARLMQREEALPEDGLLDFAAWCLDGLKPAVKPFQKEVEGISRVPARLMEEIKKLSRVKEKHLADRLAEIIDDRPPLQEALLKILRECLEEKAANSGNQEFALSLQEFFRLEDDALDICKYAFYANNYDELQRYLECELDVEEFRNRNLFAWMMNIPLHRCKSLIHDLKNIGLLDEDRNLRLTSRLESLWQEDDAAGLEEAFCQPLTGEILPLSEFNLPEADIRHIRALFSARTDTPLHVLLYGAPGTGKTTFARSLAHELGCRAYAVLCEPDDTARDRRLALAACLRLAMRDEGSFVLVDEAERILETSHLDFRNSGTDTAWLNPFLEKPGSRVIWIANHVEELEQSVRRRFAYGARFPELGQRERETMWRKLLAKRGLEEKIGKNGISRLALRYPVQAAVMEKAVRQAVVPEVACGAELECIERVLESHLVLQNGGVSRRLPGFVASYTLEGICAAQPFEEIVEQVRELDRLMRANATETEPGLGTFLFYGPPGTGKTALARHFAEITGRECMILRASDLLSPYVGETEMKIARVFAQAEAMKAVLVIDEADSFLQNRSGASHSWEVTGVNEFLTALEECRGFCVCTTNLRDQMDPAAMRRFSNKLEFLYAKAPQLEALYASILAPLVDGTPEAFQLAELRRQTSLAPGDFHAVRLRFRLRPRGSFGHADLFAALLSEQRMKLEACARPLGFTG